MHDKFESFFPFLEIFLSKARKHLKWILYSDSYSKIPLPYANYLALVNFLMSRYLRMLRKESEFNETFRKIRFCLDSASVKTGSWIMRECICEL